MALHCLQFTVGRGALIGLQMKPDLHMKNWRKITVALLCSAGNFQLIEWANEAHFNDKRKRPVGGSIY